MSSTGVVIDAGGGVIGSLFSCLQAEVPSSMSSASIDKEKSLAVDRVFIEFNMNFKFKWVK